MRKWRKKCAKRAGLAEIMSEGVKKADWVEPMCDGVKKAGLADSMPEGVKRERCGAVFREEEPVLFFAEGHEYKTAPDGGKWEVSWRTTWEASMGFKMAMLRFYEDLVWGETDTIRYI